MTEYGNLPTVPRWIDVAADAFYLVDRNGHFVHATARACAQVGYTLDEIRRLKVWDVEEVFTSEQEFRARLDTLERGDALTIKGWHRRADGSTFPVDVRVSRVTLRAEDYFVAAVRDVSDSRALEEALKQNEATLRRLVEQLPDEVYVFSLPSRRIIQANRRAVDNLGYELDEILGMELTQFVSDVSPEIPEALERLGDTPMDFAGYHHRKDGSTYPVSVRASAFSEAGQRRFMAVARDVSDRQTLERARLEAAATERSQIGVVLHDELGQRLAGARYLAEALADRLDSSGHAAASEARAIVDHVREATTLVRGVARGLAPVGVGAGELCPALEELCRSTGTLFPITCDFECEDRVPNIDDPTATGLYRIATEAVMNAVQHANPQRITVSFMRAEGPYVLSIKDDGRGISSPTERRTGTGIRLMTSRALAIGAILNIQNRDRGTEVTCVLRV